MNWLEKYRPLYLKDLRSNKEETDKCIKWIKDYKKDCKNTKKVLFIVGPIGCGKTNLANMIFQEFNYQKIELNSTDVRSQKKIGEFLRKALTYRNVVDMFNEGNKPIGILMDEIDTICKLSDKGGFSEFLSILKMNDKCESIEADKGKKSKKKKVVVSIEDYIKLYNPIICTSSEINDKKINELKKYSEVINLVKPTDSELILIINDLYTQHNQPIDDGAKIHICKAAQGDIRRLVILLEDLHYFSKGNLITEDVFTEYKKVYKEKDEDVQLMDSTKELLATKLDIKTCQKYFSVDCLLTPLMIYHNSIDYIKNCDDKPKNKLTAYKNILHSLCVQDTIQTNIFENQEWDDLYDISSVYGSAIPNYYFSTLKHNNDEDIIIQFTSLLNKISQMYVNKKLLNEAKYSLGRINFDTNEIIYLTEIISIFFEKYQISVDFDNKAGKKDLDEDNVEDDNDDDDDLVNDDLEKTTNLTSVILPKKIEAVPSNLCELIKFMNKYQIDVENLENILKIEKLNQNPDKKKKKFTLKIKKEISKYLF